MSLIRKLWLTTALLMFVIFVGSLLISGLAMRDYVEKHLAMTNMDNAALLASSLAQVTGDEGTIAALLTNRFDTGYYQSIRYIDTSGKVIIEHLGDPHVDGVPGWFLRIFPLRTAPGAAQIQDGSKRYGTLILARNPHYAYRELWSGALHLFAWFIAIAAITGLAATMLLRMLLRPLEGIVRQAEAIGARRFVTAPEPSVPEFRVVTQAMNGLARRIRQMSEDESQRLEALRREAHHDPVTGLLNRAHFMARLVSALGREDEGALGTLVIARLLDMNELNRGHGWPVMDILIRRFARALEDMAPAGSEWIPGRLNGSDFALLAPGCDDPARVARGIRESLQLIAREFGLADECRIAAAATIYRHGDHLSRVLTRVDTALAVALEGSSDSIQIAAARQRPGERDGPEGLAVWRERFKRALNANHVRLHGYPVVDARGRQLHNECVVRMRFDKTSEWMGAGEFIPWLAHLGNLQRLDDMVIELALERLQRGADDVCINLSAQSMNDVSLVHQLASKLAAAGTDALRLWIELPEHGVFQYLERFRVLCALLKPLGCHIGIEHAGHEVSRIGELHDVGIDYMKIDASFVKGIDGNQANQVFLRGLVGMARSIGSSILAEGVDTIGEFSCLMHLGFDGATGPAVTAMKVQDPMLG